LIRLFTTGEINKIRILYRKSQRSPDKMKCQMDVMMD
jgi:hypothetical protein